MIIQKFYIFAMRLSAIEGVNRQSITTGFRSTTEEHISKSKNTRHALKQSRVSFCDLIIPNPYRWLVKALAQLQFKRLLEQVNALYGQGKDFLGRAFSFSFLFWAFFFSLSFKYPEIEISKINYEIRHPAL